MATVTFNSAESLENLLSMVRGKMEQISAKISTRGFLEKEIAAYELKCSKRSWWKKLVDDSDTDNSQEGQNAYEYQRDLHRIKHTHAPRLANLRHLEQTLEMHPNSITLTDEDVYLIIASINEYDN